MLTNPLTGDYNSIETTLLKIQNDIGSSMDTGKAITRPLLDLSAAFNTIDHNILFWLPQGLVWSLWHCV